jgi:hypothetical protein
MRVKILRQITHDDGTAAIAEEVAAFEKVTERPEDLGLSIAEGKALLAAVQQRTIDAQVVSWMASRRCCEACGQRRRSKGSHAVVLFTPYGDDRQPAIASLPMPEHERSGDRVPRCVP